MWVKTTAKFRGDVSDLIWDTMDAEQQQDACEPRLFRFNTSELVAFNESRKDNCATVRFKNGYEITIDMSVNEIDKLIFT